MNKMSKGISVAAFVGALSLGAGLANAIVLTDGGNSATFNPGTANFSSWVVGGSEHLGNIAYPGLAGGRLINETPLSTSIAMYDIVLTPATTNLPPVIGSMLVSLLGGGDNASLLVNVSLYQAGIFMSEVSDVNLGGNGADDVFSVLPNYTQGSDANWTYTQFLNDSDYTNNAQLVIPTPTVGGPNDPFDFTYTWGLGVGTINIAKEIEGKPRNVVPEPAVAMLGLAGLVALAGRVTARRA